MEGMTGCNDADLGGRATPDREATPSFLTRSSSSTLIDFAQPFLVLTDSDTSQETIRNGFQVAVTIWNAFVMDRVKAIPIAR